MLALRGRRVLLGITAGIAAYKGAELARLLVRAGAEVQVVMTPAAGEFIGRLTLQAITGREVRQSLFDVSHEAAMGHIELARWADLVLIAPATADVIAQLAAGTARDLLTTLCLASEAPLLLAPAMNQAMWRHPATRDNVARLMQRGVRFLGPADGEQACGDVGPGRMLEPAAIADRVGAHFGGGRLAGRRVLLTAGPTREALDPVRFLGNRSSGKMGYALADALLAQGADLVLVSGPVALPTPRGAKRIDVESALQMYDAVFAHVAEADIFVACAAVADYRPGDVMGEKIKKDGAERLSIECVRNPDILAEVAALERRPFCVGFAAETHDVEAHAERKRRAKGLDMIAANQVGASQGFEADDNALLVIWEGGREATGRQSKVRLATRLTELIAERFDAQTATQNP
ncbi:MAG: bifunctional phosphopantothenoylcysteine decarboxylase/phosphopantothenate--cysteine ligase CoaBC [Chromatiaceae bacterium]|nr:bifunctional phosphopantothenoylcysteine decarboxylase/phosphopantothenate--cysteine ligase CoaBC [Gammaproteobacteria bacterium]MCP5300092.1 bifunctional phosphopantothenoylcysteine decarboxylase/phosphopantothenate--cysteine ligase CoaBC [Chromatiaceae bacterium]MCP5422164.1 bifunctional phosphopantothenoylcysteine decarboxylase/phosphopantothenate--cysteine ligase CoaBC [Chromatiaceae bacterium]